MKYLLTYSHSYMTKFPPCLLWIQAINCPPNYPPVIKPSMSNVQETNQT